MKNVWGLKVRRGEMAEEDEDEESLELERDDFGVWMR